MCWLKKKSPTKKSSRMPGLFQCGQTWAAGKWCDYVPGISSGGSQSALISAIQLEMLSEVIPWQLHPNYAPARRPVAKCESEMCCWRGAKEMHALDMQTEATEHLDLLESMQRVLCYREAIHVHALGKGSRKMQWYMITRISTVDVSNCWSNE